MPNDNAGGCVIKNCAVISTVTLTEHELAAREAGALVPEGWQAVPKEATREMLRAMYVTPDFCGPHIIRHSVDKLPEAYRATLAAAPKPE